MVASESAGLAVMDGAGITGDSIGVADTQCTAAAGTTPAATRFITEAISTEQEARAVVTVYEAEADPVLMPVAGLRTEASEHAAELVTVQAQWLGLSTETPRLREDTRRPAVKAASDPGRLAAILTAGRPRATPRGAVPAWAPRMPVVVEDRTPAGAVVMAVAGTGNEVPITSLSLQSVNGRDQMPRIIQNFDKLHCATFPRLVALALLATGCFLTPSLAQQPGQKTFSSPEDASGALVAATQGNNEKAMLDILGPDGKQVVSSGDDAEDAQSRANFAEKYGEMHRLVKEPDGTTILYIGARNWPTPIPLMEKGGLWYFDTEAGKQEVLYRRIGRNELSAIRVCQELVAAQKEFHSTHGDQYASKILSGPGQQNGLYWKAADGEPQSPIGPLVAAAEGNTKAQESAPTPYLGYYYRIVTRQGKNGPGGSKSYMVNGKLIGGFAFVAYPAEYRSSGVKTFTVGQDGVVYEKDLGPKTNVVAGTMKEYNPNSSWQEAEDQQEEIAGAQENND